jgi:hypothetical protein
MSWQDGIALALVAGSAAYVARCAFRTFFSAESAGCGSCPAAAEESEPAVVQIKLGASSRHLKEP